MWPFLGIVPQNSLALLARLLLPQSRLSAPSGNRHARIEGQPRPSPLLLLRRCCRSALGALRAVLRAALLAVGHADRVERAAHHVVTNTREILHTAAANEHDRVLLQVVADARDI